MIGFSPIQSLYFECYATMPMLVSFAAVIREERCVTSDDPNNGCEGDYADARRYLYFDLGLPVM